MSVYFKSMAAAVCAAVLITVPTTSNAAPFRQMPVATQADTGVTEVGRRRRHRHYPRRYHRHRRNDGHIIGGIIGGILLGAIIADAHRREQERRRYNQYSSDRHVDWCYRNYRSYREYDNSFQPYHGGRRQCISPYL